MGLTPKQEGFCKTYIETGNASEAYRQNYNAGKMKPESVNRMAKQLMDNLKIASRIEELMQHHMKRHEVTVDSLVAELEAARQMGIDLEQISPAVTAIMGKAKLHGLLKDKVEHSGTISIAEQILRANEKK